jgi:hypothetical protein
MADECCEIEMVERMRTELKASEGAQDDEPSSGTC